MRRSSFSRVSTVTVMGELCSVDGRLEVVRGVGLDAGGNVFEPTVPQAQGLLQKAYARLGHGEVRVFVRPGADDAFDRRLHAAD